MAQVINIQETFNVTQNFANVGNTDFFVYGGSLYKKLNNADPNAVDLATGNIITLTYNVQVIIPDNIDILAS